MSNIKYSKKNQKVLVHEKLNDEGDYIVQEIYVNDKGEEFPSGSKIVMRDLSDEPHMTWAEIKLKKKTERYAARIEKLENRADEQIKRLSRLYELAKVKADFISGFVDNETNTADQLETLVNFLTGRITHILKLDYYPRITKFDDTAVITESWGYNTSVEGIKLISLFGNSKGDLTYKINNYKDGSGNYVTIYPHTSYESALAQAQEVFDKNCEDYIKNDIDFGIEGWLKIDGLVVPEEIKLKHQQQLKDKTMTRIVKLKEELEKLESEL